MVLSSKVLSEIREKEYVSSSRKVNAQWSIPLFTTPNLTFLRNVTLGDPNLRHRKFADFWSVYPAARRCDFEALQMKDSGDRAIDNGTT